MSSSSERYALTGTLGKVKTPEEWQEMDPNAWVTLADGQQVMTDGTTEWDLSGNKPARPGTWVNTVRGPAQARGRQPLQGKVGHATLPLLRR